MVAAKVTTPILFSFVVLLLASQPSQRGGVMARDVECTDSEELLIDNLDAEIGKSQPCLKYKFNDNTEQPADFCPDTECLAVFNQTAAEMPDCVVRDIWVKRFVQHLVERCEKVNAGGNSTTITLPVPSTSNATAAPSTPPTATLKQNASSSSASDGTVMAGDTKANATIDTSPQPAPSGAATSKTSTWTIALICTTIVAITTASL